MGKTALLTIDDGPSSLTGELVRFLKERRIPAVMFFQGNHLEQWPEVALEALQAGMVLGNHGFSHTAFSRLSVAEGEAEIARTEALLEGIHRRAGIPRTLRLFRFPYGDKGGDQKTALAEVLARLNIERLETSAVTYPWFRDHGLDQDRDVFWTFDYLDYQLTDSSKALTWSQLLVRLDEPSPRLGGSLVAGDSAEIILMHDHPHTEAVQPGYYRELVQATLDRGITFVVPRAV